MKLPGAILAAAGLAVAASQPSPTPDPAPLTPAEQRQAWKVYVAKCAKCHRFYDPRGYDPQEWDRWMKSMSARSNLKPADEALLTRYLDDFRLGRRSGRPEDKP